VEYLELIKSLESLEYFIRVFPDALFVDECRCGFQYFQFTVEISVSSVFHDYAETPTGRVIECVFVADDMRGVDGS